MPGDVNHGQEARGDGCQGGGGMTSALLHAPCVQAVHPPMPCARPDCDTMRRAALLPRRASQALWAPFGALADRWKVGTRASVGSGPSASVGCVAKLDFLLDPLSCAPLAPPSVSRARNAAKTSGLV